MPRLTRKSKRRTADGENLIGHLHNGYCLTCSMHQAAHTDADVRPHWDQLRDTILAEWIRERPGTRPWAWWAFDSPGRRERTDGGVHPFDDKERTLYVAKSDRKDFWQRAYSLRFGMPAICLPPFDRDLYHDFMRNILQGRDSEIFEPQWSYLQRFNLLLPEDSP